jgi:hypothetical protein
MVFCLVLFLKCKVTELQRSKGAKVQRDKGAEGQRF